MRATRRLELAPRSTGSLPIPLVVHGTLKYNGVLASEPLNEGGRTDGLSTKYSWFCRDPGKLEGPTTAHAFIFIARRVPFFSLVDSRRMVYIHTLRASASQLLHKKKSLGGLEVATSSFALSLRELSLLIGLLLDLRGCRPRCGIVIGIWCVVKGRWLVARVPYTQKLPPTTSDPSLVSLTQS